MAKKNEPPQKTSNIEITTKTKSFPTISKEGEFSCVLVHPGKKHIQNYTFAPILDFIKETLGKEGFNLKLLSDETRDLQRYIDEFVKIADECVYGVVVLDGLRPNVLLELGILIALDKPFTILKSEDAEISVKTLYENCKEACLSEKQFSNLTNPILKIGGVNHLSDFSTHLTLFDPFVSKDEEKHVSIELKNSIKKLKPLINKEYTKIATKSLSGIKRESLLKDYHNILSRVLQYYNKGAEYNLDKIKKVYKELTFFEKKSKVKAPASTRSIIAFLYTSLVEKLEWKNVKEVKKYFNGALKVYNKALEYGTNAFQKAEIRMKIGNTYRELSQYIGHVENRKKAIKTYREALKVYTLERFPIDYAMTQNNLASVYSALAEVEVGEARPNNCKKAIKACKEALKVYTLERFPIDYAMTQNNLGIAYGILAWAGEARADNCKKAIKAYREALKVDILERFPMDYTAIQNNLGNVYHILAEGGARADNCKKAIKTYREALKVYTLERFPIDYAMTQNNLGNVYRTLAEGGAKADNCKKAIKAYKKALEVFTKENVFPEDYLLVRRNLRYCRIFCRSKP